MIQQMLVIWSLVPLPFLKPAWTSGSSQFMYCWSLAWRISSITLLMCEINCEVVWAFFGIALLRDWNKNWPFPVLSLLLSFYKKQRLVKGRLVGVWNGYIFIRGKLETTGLHLATARWHCFERYGGVFESNAVQKIQLLRDIRTCLKAPPQWLPSSMLDSWTSYSSFFFKCILFFKCRMHAW